MNFLKNQFIFFTTFLLLLSTTCFTHIIEWHPDNEHYAYSKDGVLYIKKHNGHDCETIYQSAVQIADVKTFSWHPDGIFLIASFSNDKTKIFKWDEKELSFFQKISKINGALWHPSGNFIIAYSDKAVELFSWDNSTTQMVQIIYGTKEYNDIITGVSLKQNGEKLACIINNNKITFTDLNGDNKTHVISDTVLWHDLGELVLSKQLESLGDAWAINSNLYPPGYKMLKNNKYNGFFPSIPALVPQKIDLLVYMDQENLVLCRYTQKKFTEESKVTFSKPIEAFWFDKTGNFILVIFEDIQKIYLVSSLFLSNENKPLKFLNKIRTLVSSNVMTNKIEVEDNLENLKVAIHQKKVFLQLQKEKLEKEKNEFNEKYKHFKEDSEKEVMNPDAFECSVCFERKIQIVFLCGHGLCQECTTKVDQCPLCRGSTIGAIKLYLHE